MDQKQAANPIIDTFTNTNSEIKKKGTLVGTEDYIAPEILNEEASGPPADLWSLGVIIYMMISGKSPFKGANQL